MSRTRRLLAAATVLALSPLAYAAPSDAAPANDSFAGATVLTGTTATATADSTGATTEAGEPSATSSSGATLWYRWTAPAAGTYVVTTEGSSYDTTLGVYTGGALASLTKVASSDNTFDLTSEVGLHAAAGTTYQIQAGGNNGATGTLHLAVTPAQITGTITVAAGGDPTLACAAVATHGSSTALASGCADATGFYAIGGVARGQYDLAFDYNNADQFYANPSGMVYFLPPTGCTDSGVDPSFVTHAVAHHGTILCPLTTKCLGDKATEDAARAVLATSEATLTQAQKHLTQVKRAAATTLRKAKGHGRAKLRLAKARTRRAIAAAQTAYTSAQNYVNAAQSTVSAAAAARVSACGPAGASL